MSGNAAKQAAQHIGPNGREARKIRKAQRKDAACRHRAQNAAHQPAGSSGHGFVGADVRAQLGPANGASHKVGEGIAAHGDGEYQHQQKRLEASRLGIQNAEQAHPRQHHRKHGKLAHADIHQIRIFPPHHHQQHNKGEQRQNGNDHQRGIEHHQRHGDGQPRETGPPNRIMSSAAESGELLVQSQRKAQKRRQGKQPASHKENAGQQRHQHRAGDAALNHGGCFFLRIAFAHGSSLETFIPRVCQSGVFFPGTARCSGDSPRR